MKASAFVRAIYAQVLDSPTWRLTFAAALVVIVVIPVGVLQERVLGWSEIVPLKIWLLHFNHANWDSWEPMRQALEYVRASGADSLYQEVFFKQAVKFQYPPTALLPILGLQSLGLNLNQSLNNINRALIALNAFGVGWLFHLMLVRIKGREAAASPAGTAGAILVGTSTLVFYPLMVGFWLGQIQVWIDTGFTFACIAMLSSRRLAAGILIGLLCTIKPQFGAFAIWALARRQWRFMLGAVISLVPVFLISIYTFGWTAHLDYLRVLAFLSRRGEALIENNSVNGILNALLGTANPLVWDLHKFPPYSPIVHGGTLAAAILLVVASVWRRQGQNAYNALLDFQIAAMAYTMEAPIAWEHHYGIMPPVFATLFCILSSRPESVQRRRQLIALGAVFLVSALCITSSKYTVPTQLNLAHGYLFFAGLALIVMLWRASAQAQEPIALSGDVEPARGSG